MSNEDTFLALYASNLASDVRSKPTEYGYPESEAPSVAVKMVAGLKRGSANKDSNAIRRTCKALGIKFTYSAIKEYLNT